MFIQEKLNSLKDVCAKIYTHFFAEIVRSAFFFYIGFQRALKCLNPMTMEVGQK